MDTSEKGTNRTLAHVHMCVHCGSIFRREEYESRALTSGIYLCPKCGLEGPLNVVIREVEESEQGRLPPPKDSPR
jgi:predicted RNA-binding Zn-ribbon protein involved in translation (DUF1610 family)